MESHITIQRNVKKKKESERKEGTKKWCDRQKTNKRPDLNPTMSIITRSPGGGHGKPLQYSCLDNPMDRRA